MIHQWHFIAYVHMNAYLSYFYLLQMMCVYVEIPCIKVYIFKHSVSSTYIYLHSSTNIHTHTHTHPMQSHAYPQTHTHTHTYTHIYILAHTVSTKYLHTVSTKYLHSHTHTRPVELEARGLTKNFRIETGTQAKGSVRPQAPLRSHNARRCARTYIHRRREWQRREQDDDSRHRWPRGHHHCAPVVSGRAHGDFQWW